MNGKELISSEAVRCIARKIYDSPETATDGEILCMCKYLLGKSILKSTLQEQFGGH